MSRVHAGALARRIGASALISIVFVGGGSVSTASGSDVSAAQLERLAAQAAGGDAAALATIGAVTSVDGRPASPAASLGDAHGADLTARLRQMELAVRESGSAAPGNIDAVTEAKKEAADSGGSSGSGSGISLGLPPLFRFLFGGAVLIGALIAARVVGRRRVFEVAAATGGGQGEGDEGSAGALERKAKDAEKKGDFAAAVSFRFAAGLLRLDDMGAVPIRPSLTPAVAARESGSPTLGSLASTYAGILYGGHPAAEGDARSAREGWPDALREAKESR